MSTENQAANPAEVIAKDIKSAVDQVNAVAKQVEGAVNEIKSFQDFQKAKSEIDAEVKSIKEVVETKSSEEIKSLKMEIDALKEKQKKSISATSNEGEVEYKNFDNFKNIFANAINNKQMVSFDACGKESKSIFNACGFVDIEKKSIVTYDNSVAGQLIPEAQRLGLLNVNLQTLSQVTSIVNNISAGNITKGLAYDTIDAGDVEILEGNENNSAGTTPLAKYDEIFINLAQYKAKFPISDKILHSAAELRFNPIQRMITEIERRFEKNIAKNILNGDLGGSGVMGILPIAQKQARKHNIRVEETATTNVLTLQDLFQFGKKLKMEYMQSNPVMVIDKLAFYSVAGEEGTDGHLKSEYYTYNDQTGIGFLKTPSGLVRIILVEQEDGFVNYPSFDDGSNITQGFIDGGTNTGKAVAVLGSFNRGYTLARSSIAQVGFTKDNISALLEKGYIFAGKYGYVGGNVTIAESMCVLTIK